MTIAVQIYLVKFILPSILLKFVHASSQILLMVVLFSSGQCTAEFFFKDQKVVTFDDMTEQCIWFHDIHKKYYFVFKPNSIRPSLIFVYKSVISAWRGDKVSLANC